MIRTFDKPFVLKEKHSENWVGKEDTETLNINWKLYDKIIKAKFEQGKLNYPIHQSLIIESNTSVPYSSIKAGDCVEVSGGQRSIVFEQYDKLWVMIGLRKELLTPRPFKHGWMYSNKTLAIWKVIFTKKQAEHIHNKFGIVK